MTELKTQKKLNLFPPVFTQPILVRVKDGKTIEKGEIFKIKRFYFVAANEKIAYDGKMLIAAYPIAEEDLK